MGISSNKKYIIFIIILVIVIAILIYSLIHKSNTPSWQGSDGTQGIGKDTSTKPAK